MQNNIRNYLSAVKMSSTAGRRMKAAIALLSLFVVLGTFWWLKLTGITLAGEAFCGMEEHTHTDQCVNCTLTEHIHTESCYSDLTADLETADMWEATFADAELTGFNSVDLVCIAVSQIGYNESTLNFQINDAAEKCGYTRYGEWYGNPYGDWSAMFVSFCLRYAGLADVPVSAGPETMRLNWESQSLYAAQMHEPIAGDLVFFDEDGSGAADAVGIISAVSGTQINVIRGDYDDAVCQVNFADSDNSIIGYGSIREAIRRRATEAELVKVSSVMEMIDALPLADNVEAQLAACEEADDMTAYESYFEQTGWDVIDAYTAYEALGSDLKLLVEDTTKLEELDWMRSSPSLMISGISSNKPATVESADTSELIRINLYDYGSNINTKYSSNKKYPGFQWNGGAYLKGTYDRHTVDMIDFGNSEITDLNYGSGSSNGKSPNSVNVANQGGTINKIDISDYGINNRPIGFSLGSDYEAISRTLSNGYPALTDGTSLSYLFSDGTYADQQNTANINGLFRYDEETGKYYYDSRNNHAQYSNNTFTLYNQIITPNFIVYPFGNFLPFNDITNSAYATQVSQIKRIATGGSSGYSGYIQTIINRLLEGSEDSTQTQLVEMLAMYRNDLGDLGDNSSARYTWNAADAINDYFFSSGDGPAPDQGKFTMNGYPYLDEESTKPLLQYLYNIDYDVEKNFFFGLDMHLDFMMAKDGMTGPNGDQPMVYEFSGDDDVWIYIDGVLFLDLTGIHRHVGGKIDFVNGKVYYYALDDSGDGDVTGEAYAEYTFAQLLAAAGKSTDVLNENGIFADYTEHTLDFYYMERGSGSSVMEMSFNLPILQDNRISVAKELDEKDVDALGNPDFFFQIYKENGQDLLIGENVEFTVMDQSGNTSTRKTGANGIFILKAGERAVFTIPENAGKYFVRELLDTSVFEQYGDIQVNGSSTTRDSYTNVTIGASTFTGVASDVKNISDGNTTFIFNNVINKENYGSLKITKTANEYTADQVDKEFTFLLWFDDVLVPAGTQYTLIDADGTETMAAVVTAGKLTLKAGQTARFGKLVAGSAVRLQETAESAAGYLVEYTGTNITLTDSSEGGTEGVIAATKPSGISVLNDREGTKLEIEAKKTLLYPDGAAHTYTFILRQICSLTDHSYMPGGTHLESTATLASGSSFFRFVINYPSDTTQAGTWYYSIWEKGAAAENGMDTNFYILQVTTKIMDGKVTATVDQILKNGTETEDGITFENRNVRDLTITKTVEGTQTDQAFLFIVRLYLNGDPIGGTFACTGTSGQTAVTFADGMAQVELKDGEALTITGLPCGAQWTVTEQTAIGYFTHCGITGTDLQKGNEVSGSLTADAAVSFLNIGSPELPATGTNANLLILSAGALLMVISAATACVLRYRRGRRHN